MNVVQSAREHAKNLVSKATEKVLESLTTQSRVQAVTIGRPRQEVASLFEDPERLSMVFGDIADVQSIGADRQKWTFRPGDGPNISWECVVSNDDSSHLRFVDVHPNGKAGVALEFRDAPQDRGTEVIARVSSPAPGALTGPLAFKALYRARALLMTGEIPTIEHNPSARASDR
jgi:uncharacterized membrane protein